MRACWKLAVVCFCFFPLLNVQAQSLQSPRLLGSCDTPGMANGVYVWDHYVFVADGPSGVQVIDISQPTNAQLVGHYQTTGAALRVDGRSNYLYVAANDSGLVILNVASPTNPTLAGVRDTTGYANDVCVVGHYAYVADAENGLQIIDVANAASPFRVGGYNTNFDSALSVFVTNHFAYVGDGTHGLKIFDVTTPSNPQYIGFYPMPGTAYGVYGQGTQVLVANGEAGLYVLGVTNPAAPILLSHYNTIGPAIDVQATPYYAFVARATNGMQIFSILQPTNLVPISSRLLLGWANDLYLRGMTLYVAADTAGLQMAAIGDPYAPYLSLMVSTTRVVCATSQGVSTGAQFEVWSMGGRSEVSYRVQSGTPWLSVSPTSGTTTGEHDTISLAADTAALTPGTYTGRLAILSADVANQNVRMDVAVTVAAVPVWLNFLPQTNRLSIYTNETRTLTNRIEIWNQGGLTSSMAYTLSGSASWFSLSTTSGVSAGAHTFHSVIFSNLSSLGVGSYTGSITLAASSVPNSPQTMPVILTVMPHEPCLEVGTNGFSVAIGQGQNPSALDLPLRNSGAGVLSYSVSASESWIGITPVEGSSAGEWDHIQIELEASALAAAAYRGTIFVSVTNQAAPHRIPVALIVQQEAVVIGSRASLFGSQAAGSGVVTQRFEVWNEGTGVLDYAVSGDAAWMSSLAPSTGQVSGAQRQAHEFIINPANLVEGIHTGQVSIVSASAVNSPRMINVYFTLAPRLTNDPWIVTNGSYTGLNAPSQTLRIWNAASTNPVAFTLSTDAPWLQVSPTSGISSGNTNEITLSYLSDQLPAGYFSGNIRLTAGDLVRFIRVGLRMTESGGVWEEKIVFHSDRDGDQDIWMINPDGSGLTTLVQRVGQQVEPQVSPNGKRLAYREVEAGFSRLCVIDFMTGAEYAFTNVFGARWLPDSSGLVGVNSLANPNKAYRFPLTGKMVPILTAERDRKAIIGVAPNSEDIYYVLDAGALQSAQIRKFAAATGKMTTILNSMGRALGEGQLNTAGDALAYARTTNRLSSMHGIYIYDLTSQSELLISSMAGSRDLTPAFSPNAERVAFIRYFGYTNTALCVVEAASAAETVLLQDSATNGAPCWSLLYLASPDRTQLSISTNRIHLTAVRLETNNPVQSLDIWNAGQGTLTFRLSNTVAWLSSSRGWGESTGAADRVSVEAGAWATHLSEGVHTGLVVISSESAETNVLVMLTVEPPWPVMELATTQIVCGISMDQLFTSRPIAVRNRGGRELTFTGSVNRSWMNLSIPSTSSTGEWAALKVVFSSSGLELGSYSGQVAVATVLGTQATPVVLHVFDPNTNPPVLMVDATNIALSSHRYRSDAGTNVLHVRNAGGRSMDVTLTNVASWISIAEYIGNPLQLSGGSDAILTLTYGASNLPEGWYTNTFLIQTTNAGSQSVKVTLHVQAPLERAFYSHVEPAGAGQIIRDPPEASYVYEDMAVVRFTAESSLSNFYEFAYWHQSNETTRLMRFQPSLNVQMDQDWHLTAVFQQFTRLRGVVTNVYLYDQLQLILPPTRHEGEQLIDLGSEVPLEGVTVTCAGQSTTTDVTGFYQIEPALPGPADVVFSRPGYLTATNRIFMTNHQDNVCNAGLVDDSLMYVSARQRPGTRLVDVVYGIKGLPGDRYLVDWDVSCDTGLTWNVDGWHYAGDLQFYEGDVLTGVGPGLGNHFTWDAGRDWGEQYSTQMLIKIRAGQSVRVSPPFTLDTRGVENLQLRVWIDRNRNDAYDPGEGAQFAEVYYKGRMPAHSLGLVLDPDGLIELPETAFVGQEIFARREIYSRQRVKDPIARFNDDNRMYTIWMDSDMGSGDDSVWNGKWRSRYLNRFDIENARQGQPINVRLRHPVFEWDLYVASRIADPNYIAILEEGFARASTYLYDVTDGQMKFGRICIVPGAVGGSAESRPTDIEIRDLQKYRANADILGRLNKPGYVRLGREIVHSNKTTGVTYTNSPTTSEYYTTIVHELGHYLFGFYDEYMNGYRMEGNWDGYMHLHADEIPSIYGFMHDQRRTTEMSSYNDYLPSYPDGGSTNLNRMGITWQIYMKFLSLNTNFLPCWQDFEDRFEDEYDGVPVEITVPRYGYFHQGRSVRGQDREGPTNIPLPYARCIVTTGAVDRPLVKTAQPAARWSAPVAVRSGDAPQADAVVTIRPVSRPGLRYLGKTGPDGFNMAYDLQIGDVLQATWQGQTVSRTLTEQDRNQTLVLDLQEGAQLHSGPALNGHWLLSTNRLGLLVSGTLDANTNWGLRIEASEPLSVAPTAIVYPDDAAGVTVQTYQVTATLYTGLVSLAFVTDNGYLELHAHGATSDDNYTLFDAWHVAVAYPNEGIWISPDGWARVGLSELPPSEFIALAYQQNGPVILPAGFGYNHQIGSTLWVGPMEALNLSATNMLSLNIYYQDEDVLGLDETSVALHRWVEGNSSWVGVPHHQSVNDNVISATITNLGIFALFANASSDTNAPAAITDLLAAPGDSPRSIRLNWTAVSDDGAAGPALKYDLRYAHEEITAQNWASATRYAIAQAPLAPGSQESFDLIMSDSGQLYYFGVCALDEAGNSGALGPSAAARSSILDDDGDGIADDWLAAANLGRETPMTAQDDVDGDGLTTLDEYIADTDANLWDTDADGINDGWEIEHNLNPTSADDASLDNDQDGLSNKREYDLSTNPDSIDSDGDGMNDLWETQRTLLPNTAAGQEGGASDIDGDGFNNYQEYLADTDPTNVYSLLEVYSILGCPNVSIEFLTATTRLYAVDYSTNLTQSTWSLLEHDFYGEGGLTTINDTNGVSPRIYRVKARPPGL
ncbi:MAG TPA: hypothetical protein DCZ95_19620 [Verrucomicrobia bacterium]|nr:MAG: hypothetical protein A2X46_03020 [Lentisphaerae bacterium GWF2_57_35]HBA86295.1 hypothetical protein [Verrucomicrobiota bacterium]